MRKIGLKIFVLTAFLFHVISTNAKGETNEATSLQISGKVIDEASKKPIEYATVAIYSATDSSLISGTVTDANGLFKINGLSKGEYYLQVNFIGFEKKITQKISLSNRKASIDLGEIGLKPANVELEGVVVKGEKSRVEYKIDKKVINVDKDLTSKGGTAATALENTPSVQVDTEGNVTLRGSSNFTVLIDGKPTALKGSDALKQIPAAAIKQIEVITNPSAKYDADGQAGIINIIMEKNKMLGLNGNVSVSYGNAHKRTGNILLNYRLKKVNFFGGIDFNDNVSHLDLDMNNYTMLNSDTLRSLNDGVQMNQNYNFSYKGGMDIDFNENNSMSVSGNVGNQSYDRGVNSNIKSWYIPLTNDMYSASRNINDVSGFVTGANADFTHKFTENHTLSFSGTFSSWNGPDKNTLDYYSTNSDFENFVVASRIKYRKDDYNYQARFNVDYSKQIKEGKFEAGVQYRYEHRNEDYVFQNYDVNTDTWTVNSNFTYDLRYKNPIYSGYATYSNKLWSIDYQVGVRSEYFDRKITHSNSSDPIVYSKFMLYPSLHFSKNFNDKHQLQLSYSRRVNRPMPFLLNDIPQYIDTLNIFMGSPYMKPEYTDSYEFNYRVSLAKVTISAQSYYRNTTNVFAAIRTMRDDGVMIHQYTNADRETAFGEELGVDFKVAKWWQLSTGGNLYHYTLDATVNSTARDQQVNTWDARLISNFNLKWGTRIQAVGYYRAPSVDANGDVSDFYVVNLAVNQPIMKGKGSIGISARNLLNSIKFDINMDGLTYSNTYAIRVEGPIVMVNFSYRFNNFQNRQRGRTDDTNFSGANAF
ncbi:MAG: TonB-dependent receptor [Bacteroidales bacterium]|nr:TonB-dependent receptor [Bacteroidales bacterium]